MQLPQRKTRFLAFAAASIDGKISLTTKHPPDWTSSEDWRLLQRSLANVDAVVAGRNTYLAVRDRLRRRQTYVLTSRIRRMQRRGTVTFLNPQFTNLATVLRPYRTVAIVGGGMTYQTMLDLGLFDELYLTVEPLVFGHGRDMFQGGHAATRWRLRSLRRLNRRGTILLHYLRRP